MTDKYLVILAAGRGARLRPLTDSRPKCLVEVGGRPLLDWQLSVAHAEGIHNIAVVRGYMKDRISRPGLTYFENAEYETTNMVETLWCAESVFDGGVVVSYGDIIYEPSVLERLLASDHEINVVVDCGWRPYWEQRFDDVLDDAETLLADESGRITSIGQKPSSLRQVQGQYIGLMAFNAGGVEALRCAYRRAREEASEGHNPLRGQRPLRGLFMTDLLQGIIDSGFPVYQVPIHRGWLEIDSAKDLELAERSITLREGGFAVSA